MNMDLVRTAIEKPISVAVGVILVVLFGLPALLLGLNLLSHRRSEP